MFFFSRLRQKNPFSYPFFSAAAVLPTNVNAADGNRKENECVSLTVSSPFILIRAAEAFGEVYCRLSNFVANMTVAASVFTLTATSFDR